MSTFAKIDPNQNPNVVINIQILNEGDYQDPAFTWVDMTQMSPQPQIGWLYDGKNFTQPGLPNDIYGYTVTLITANNRDIYTNSAGIIANLAHGAPQGVAYLSLAIQTNIAQFKNSAEEFIQSRYSDSMRLNLMGLVLNAQINNLTNRLAYLAPLLTWQNSIISYLATYVANVQAQVTPAAVAAITPDFSSFIASDPLVTVIAAIQISN